MKMNRSILLGLGVVISLGLGLHSYLARPAIAQPAKPANKIEYSTLSFGTNKEVSYIAANKTLKGDNWWQLCTKLGGKAGHESVDAMNILGLDGWELVAVEFRPDPINANNTTTLWYFKRQQ